MRRSPATRSKTWSGRPTSIGCRPWCACRATRRRRSPQHWTAARAACWCRASRPPRRPLAAVQGGALSAAGRARRRAWAGRRLRLSHLRISRRRQCGRSSSRFRSRPPKGLPMSPRSRRRKASTWSSSVPATSRYRSMPSVRRAPTGWPRRSRQSSAPRWRTARSPASSARSPEDVGGWAAKGASFFILASDTMFLGAGVAAGCAAARGGLGARPG